VYRFNYLKNILKKYIKYSEKNVIMTKFVNNHSLRFIIISVFTIYHKSLSELVIHRQIILLSASTIISIVINVFKIVIYLFAKNVACYSIIIIIFLFLRPYLLIGFYKTPIVKKL